MSTTTRRTTTRRPKASTATATASSALQLWASSSSTSTSTTEMESFDTDDEWKLRGADKNNATTANTTTVPTTTPTQQPELFEFDEIEHQYKDHHHHPIREDLKAMTQSALDEMEQTAKVFQKRYLDEQHIQQDLRPKQRILNSIKSRLRRKKQQQLRQERDSQFQNCSMDILFLFSKVEAGMTRLMETTPATNTSSDTIIPTNVTTTAIATNHANGTWRILEQQQQQETQSFVRQVQQRLDTALEELSLLETTMPTTTTIIPAREKALDVVLHFGRGLSCKLKNQSYSLLLEHHLHPHRTQHDDNNNNNGSLNLTSRSQTNMTSSWGPTINDHASQRQPQQNSSSSQGASSSLWNKTYVKLWDSAVTTTTTSSSSNEDDGTLVDHDSVLTSILEDQYHHQQQQQNVDLIFKSDVTTPPPPPTGDTATATTAAEKMEKEQQKSPTISATSRDDDNNNDEIPIAESVLSSKKRGSPELRPFLSSTSSLDESVMPPLPRNVTGNNSSNMDPPNKIEIDKGSARSVNHEASTDTVAAKSTTIICSGDSAKKATTAKRSRTSSSSSQKIATTVSSQNSSTVTVADNNTAKITTTTSQRVSGVSTSSSLSSLTETNDSNDEPMLPHTSIMEASESGDANRIPSLLQDDITSNANTAAVNVVANKRYEPKQIEQEPPPSETTTIINVADSVRNDTQCRPGPTNEADASIGNLIRAEKSKTETTLTMTSRTRVAETAPVSLSNTAESADTSKSPSISTDAKKVFSVAQSLSKSHANVTASTAILQDISATTEGGDDCRTSKLNSSTMETAKASMVLEPNVIGSTAEMAMNATELVAEMTTVRAKTQDVPELQAAAFSAPSGEVNGTAAAPSSPMDLNDTCTHSTREVAPKASTVKTQKKLTPISKATTTTQMPNRSIWSKLGIPSKRPLQELPQSGLRATPSVPNLLRLEYKAEITTTTGKHVTKVTTSTKLSSSKMKSTQEKAEKKPITYWSSLIQHLHTAPTIVVPAKASLARGSNDDD